MGLLGQRLFDAVEQGLADPAEHLGEGAGGGLAGRGEIVDRAIGLVAGGDEGPVVGGELLDAVGERCPPGIEARFRRLR